MCESQKPAAARITMICAECGSKNVMRDAWAEWDETRQEWVLGPVFDQAACEDCGGETRLVELPIDADGTLLPVFKPKERWLKDPRMTFSPGAVFASLEIARHHLPFVPEEDWIEVAPKELGRYAQLIAR